MAAEGQLMTVDAWRESGTIMEIPEGATEDDGDEGDDEGWSQDGDDDTEPHWDALLLGKAARVSAGTGDVQGQRTSAL